MIETIGYALECVYYELTIVFQDYPAVLSLLDEVDLIAQNLGGV